MPESFVWNIAASVIMMALSGACGVLWGRIKGASEERRKKAAEADDERDTNRAALRELFLYRLQDIHADYVVGNKPCSVAEKHRAEEAYRLYHDKLGGNGTGTQLYKEIMALHVE